MINNMIKGINKAISITMDIEETRPDIKESQEKNIILMISIVELEEVESFLKKVMDITIGEVIKLLTKRKEKHTKVKKRNIKKKMKQHMKRI